MAGKEKQEYDESVESSTPHGGSTNVDSDEHYDQEQEGDEEAEAAADGEGIVRGSEEK